MHANKEVMVDILSNPDVFGRIPLPPPTVSIDQAMKDFRRERVLLNDVPFIPDQNDVNRSNGFALTLTRLCSRFSPNAEEAKEMSDLIIQRSCRTSAGADSFFMVQKLLCMQGTFVTQKTHPQSDPPIRIDVFLGNGIDRIYVSNDNSIPSAGDRNSTSSSNRYSSNSVVTTETSSSVAGGSAESILSCLEKSPGATEHNMRTVHARVEISNSFALYDIAAVDELTGNEVTDPVPLLDIEAVVIDESNLTTRQNWRRLQLSVLAGRNSVANSNRVSRATSVTSYPQSSLSPRRQQSIDFFLKRTLEEMTQKKT